MRLLLWLLLLGAVSAAPVWADTDADDPQAVRNPFESSIDETVMANPKLVQSAPRRAGDEPVLQGVAIGGGKASAIINGIRYSQGEARGEIEVLEVRKREADIKWNGTAMTIQMNRAGTQAKKPAAPAASNTSSSFNGMPAYYGQSTMGMPDSGRPVREES